MKTNSNQLLPNFASIITEIQLREALGLSGDYSRRVEKKLAHKVIESNVLLCQMEYIDPINTTLFEVVNDCQHPFYYEHPIDHMSGSNMTEIALQGVKIILHLHGGVDMKTQLALVSCNATYFRYVEHDLALYMTASIDKQQAQNDPSAPAKVDFCFIQGGEICAKIEIQCKIISPERYSILLQNRRQRLHRLQNPQRTSEIAYA
jgi:hypothetical protein